MAVNQIMAHNLDMVAATTSQDYDQWPPEDRAKHLLAQKLIDLAHEAWDRQLQEVTHLDKALDSDAGFYEELLYKDAQRINATHKSIYMCRSPTVFITNDGCAGDVTYMRILFDQFKWSVTYEKRLECELLQGDFGPLPPSWTPCRGIYLAAFLALYRSWVFRIQNLTKERTVMHLIRHRTSWPLARAGHRIIKTGLKLTRDTARRFNQTLQNMAHEISTAMAEIEQHGGSTGGENHPQMSISEMLSREIRRAYPEAEDLPDFAVREEILTLRHHLTRNEDGEEVWTTQLVELDDEKGAIPVFDEI